MFFCMYMNDEFSLWKLLQTFIKLWRIHSHIIFRRESSPDVTITRSLVKHFGKTLSVMNSKTHVHQRAGESLENTVIANNSVFNVPDSPLKILLLPTRVSSTYRSVPWKHCYCQQEWIHLTSGLWKHRLLFQQVMEQSEVNNNSRANGENGQLSGRISIRQTDCLLFNSFFKIMPKLLCDQCSAMTTKIMWTQLNGIVLNDMSL